MFKIKCIFLAIFFTNFIIVQTVNAASTAVPTGGATAVASFATATAAIGAGATVVVKTEGFWKGLVGGVLAVGGLALGFVDPPGGTFYSGMYMIHYNPAVMQVNSSGWLGSWGINPALTRPPVIPANSTFSLQAPNAGLAASVVDDNVAGELTIDFDWGPAGHIETEDEFNMFGALFEFTAPVQFEYLGDASSPPPGANFYVSMINEIQCQPDGGAAIVSCGHPTTSYFRVTRKVDAPISVPATTNKYFLFSVIIMLLIFALIWLYRQKSTV